VNVKMNDFVGEILQNKFYAYCYILLLGTRRCTPIYGAAFLGEAGAEISLLLTALNNSQPIDAAHS